MIKIVLSLTLTLLFSQGAHAGKVKYIGSFSVENKNGPYNCGVTISTKSNNSENAVITPILEQGYSRSVWVNILGIKSEAIITKYKDQIEYDGQNWFTAKDGDDYLLDTTIYLKKNHSHFGHIGVATLHSEPGFFLSGMTFQCWLFKKK